MSSLSFFPLIPAVTTASAAPVYHGGMIPCLGDVEPVNTRWLVKGYFPMGAVSVVAGPGGVGKGVFMADVVAAVTTGRPTMLFPDAAVTQGNVLVLTSEDDPGMSLAPRMIAAEALIRPYLSEAQNEILSEILEGLVASVAEHSFQIGYSSAMQTFAEAAAAFEAKSHAQQ